MYVILERNSQGTLVRVIGYYTDEAEAYDVVDKLKFSGSLLDYRVKRMLLGQSLKSIFANENITYKGE